MARGVLFTFLMLLFLVTFPVGQASAQTFTKVSSIRKSEILLLAKQLRVSAQRIELGCYGNKKVPALTLLARSGASIRVSLLSRLRQRTKLIVTLEQKIKRTCSTLKNVAAFNGEYLALYPMNDALPQSQGALDLSGAGRHAYCSASECPVATSAVAPQGSAPSFDGVNDRLITDPFGMPSGQGLTVGAFVELQPNSRGTLIGQFVPASGVELWSIKVEQNGSQLQYRFSVRANQSLSSLVAPVGAAAGSWAFVAGVFDPLSMEMRLYENGVQLVARHKSGLLPTTAPAPLAIGGQPASPANNFLGRVGLSGVSASVFSASRIAEIYQAFLLGSLPTATPISTITPTVTATSSPTATVIPTITFSPSPTSTATTSPTATTATTPSSTPTRTPTPTPTATPVQTQQGSITPVVSVSGASGPAPRAVAFDASATTGLAANDLVGATFIWNFGDDPSAIWPHSGKSMNRSIGAHTGHIYQAPGSYTARLRVVDRAGNRSNEYTIPVNVTSASQTWTQTYCISASGTDTSCAPGAIALSSLQQAFANAAPGRRFLIQRGFQQTINSSIALANVTGPVYFGAYGSGAMPQFVFPSTATEAALYINSSQDVIFEDLALRGPNPATGVGARWGIYLDSNRVLLNRLSISGFTRNVHLAGTTSSPIRTGNFIANSALEDAGYFSVTNSGNFRLTTVLGNYFNNSTQGHIRLLESQKTIIAHNRFVGSHAIKSHSGNTVVVDNFFDGGTYSRISYGTGGSLEACDAATKVNHLLEGNVFWGVSSTYSGGVGGANFKCGGEIVGRGNIFHDVGGAFTIDGSSLESGFSGVNGVRIYNNYSQDDRGPTYASNFLNITGPIPNVRVENNVLNFPGLNFRNGEHTAVVYGTISNTTGLHMDHNIWYLPNSNGNNNSTPGLFIQIGNYPAHIGYSRTIQSAGAVQYFGTLNPLSSWHALGLDQNTLFQNPGTLSLDAQGNFFLSPSSPAFTAGDSNVPYYVDFYGRERATGAPNSAGPFFQ